MECSRPRKWVLQRSNPSATWLRQDWRQLNPEAVPKRGGFNFTEMDIPLRKPLPSVGKKRLVDGDVGQYSVEGLVVHCHTSHKCQHGFLVGHRGSHAGYHAEVTVEAFYSVGDVDHRLYLGGVIDISHQGQSMNFVKSIEVV